MGQASRVPEKTAVEPARIFTSTTTARTAPPTASAPANTRGMSERATKDAPTTAASKNSARRATASSVASGADDQTSESALQARNPVSAASAAHAGRATR